MAEKHQKKKKGSALKILLVVLLLLVLTVGAAGVRITRSTAMEESPVQR